jgi:hypothetical protein
MHLGGPISALTAVSVVGLLMAMPCGQEMFLVATTAYVFSLMGVLVEIPVGFFRSPSSFLPTAQV